MSTNSPLSSTIELINKGRELFAKEFECQAEVCAYAPGRVNLIGEHTDYNQGFVLPMTIPLVTVVVGKRTDSHICRVVTDCERVDEPKRIEFDLPSDSKPLTAGAPKWGNYVKGVVAHFKGKPVGFDAVILSSIPAGGGLSSSAALEVALYTFLEFVTNTKTEPMAKALACQKSEHEFAKVPCGIMDQFVCAMGKPGTALMIDCKLLESKEVRLPPSDLYSFLITNSNVSHNLASSEYAQRRDSCFQTAKKLSVASLRETNTSALKGLYDRPHLLNDTSYLLARHVLTEIERTESAVEALNDGDYVKFGQLMNESHLSLRLDYEVSCAELDLLVETAQKVDGVFGSRMTGAGFGGCTITLVKNDAVNNVIEAIQKAYPGKATFYVVTKGECANALSLPLELE